MEIYLIRHGRQCDTRCNVDVALSEAGFRQADLVGRRMKDWNIQKVYSSDMIRARQTAETANKHWNVELEIVPQFREIYFGSLENSRETEVSSRQFFSAWLSGQPTGDGESFETFRTRIMNALTSLIRCCREENVSSVTVVTHSGVIRTLLLTLRHLEPTAFPTLSTPNGLGFILTLDISQSQPQLIHDEPIPFRSSLAASDPSRKKRDLQPAKG